MTLLLLLLLLLYCIVLESGKPGGREYLEDRRRCENNIKIDLQ